MTFKLMFDENIPVKVVRGLQAIVPLWYPNDLVGYLPKFTDKSSKDDKVWIPKLSTEGWVLLTADRGKSNIGSKLPRLCRQHRLTHILIGRSIHDLLDVPKLCGFMSMWDEFSAVAKVAPGTHYRLFKHPHQSMTLERVQSPDATT